MPYLGITFPRVSEMQASREEICYCDINCDYCDQYHKPLQVCKLNGFFSGQHSCLKKTLPYSLHVDISLNRPDLYPGIKSLNLVCQYILEYSWKALTSVKAILSVAYLLRCKEAQMSTKRGISVINRFII